MPTLQSTRRYYEQRTWPADTSPKERERFAAITAHLPAHFDSLLEVGCGDGRLSDALPHCRRMAFLDLSASALRQFRRAGASCLQASAGRLPFPDRSFEVVVCSEVMEHLPQTEFDACRHELARVSAGQVIVTMPYRETLRAEAYRCAACGAAYHVYGHLRSVSRGTMRGLIPGFKAREVWTFGTQRRWLWLLAQLRAPRVGGLCPACGHGSPYAELSASQKAIDWLNQHSGYQRPYWIGGSYKRMAR